MNTNTKRLLCTLAGTAALLTAAGSDDASRIEIDLGKRGAEIPASLYGVFFEEITGSGDGGLYAEMIRNRGFDCPTARVCSSSMTRRIARCKPPPSAIRCRRM